MKKVILISFVLSIIFLTSQPAFAAKRVTLVNGSGVEIGTTADPIIATAV